MAFTLHSTHYCICIPDATAAHLCKSRYGEALGDKGRLYPRPHGRMHPRSRNA